MKIAPLTLHLLILLCIAAHITPLDAAENKPSQPNQMHFFGMNTYFTGLERINRDHEEGIARLVSMGRTAEISFVREELSWANLERKGKGQWEWDYFDRRLLQIAQSGYGIVGMLLTTPAWARVADCPTRTQRYAGAGVSARDYWCPPANPQDFADYVSAIVERYDGDGNTDAPGSPRIAAWQIWNEPNHWETWPGYPQEYAMILQAGYTAAKAADATTIVAVGGLYVFDGSWTDGIGHSDGLRFLDTALAAAPTVWNAFDVLAIHPHMPDVAPDQPGIIANVTLWGRLSTARTWLQAKAQQYGGLPRPMWVSEIGWSTCTTTEMDCYIGEMTQSDDPTDMQPHPSHWHVTVGSGGLQQSLDPTASADNSNLRAFIGKDEQQQANYMVRSHVLAHALGVQHFSYFQLEDKFDGSLKNFWEEASILHTYTTGYKPKAAYYAYAVMVNQLKETHFVGWGAQNTFAYIPQTVPNPTARYHLRFQTTDNVFIDVFWRNSGTEEVSLQLEPTRSAELVSRDGVYTPVNDPAGVVRFTISETPVYIRQTKAAALEIMPSVVSTLAEPNMSPITHTLIIGNSGSGIMNWTISGLVPWIEIPIRSGQGWRSEIPLIIHPTGLPIGEYNTLLTINSTIGLRQIPIKLNVVAKLWKQNVPLMLR